MKGYFLEKKEYHLIFLLVNKTNHGHDVEDENYDYGDGKYSY